MNFLLNEIENHPDVLKKTNPKLDRFSVILLKDKEVDHTDFTQTNIQY